MRNLIIILLASVILFSITLVSNRHHKEVDFVKRCFTNNNQLLRKANDKIYNIIKKQVLKYPAYQSYLAELDTIRPLISKMKIEQSSYQEIYHQVATIDHYAIADLSRKLDTTIIKTSLFQDDLFQAQLTSNESNILNFIGERSRGGKIGYPTTYFLPIHTTNYCCLGDTFEGQYLVSIMECSYGDRDFKVTVNEEPISLKRFEGKFQLKPTSTGKQTYKVTLEAMNSKTEIEKHERVFEYWVRE